jgi:hypothetical protein
MVFSRSALAGVFLASSVSTALAEPIITYTHPEGSNLLGGQQVREVDCGTLVPITESGKTKLYVTFAFTRQVDANGQSLGIDPPNPTIQDHTSALVSSIIHFGRQHGTCLPQAIDLDRKTGKTDDQLDLLYPPGWQNPTELQKHCPLIEAAEMCRDAMGLN